VAATQARHYPIHGALFTVNPMAIRRRKPDVYTENERVVVLLRSRRFGLVLCVAVGATVVGSIQLLAHDGDALEKGAQHGVVAFGGSTCLFFFQRGAVAWDDDLLRNSAMALETIVQVGARIGGAAGDAAGGAALAQEEPPL
jgi:phosphatidylserine decarboxylase